MKAALERSPVSIEKYQDLDIQDAYTQLRSLSDESIYEGSRLAQPDEVANYNTGDGLEKAVTLANIIHQRQPDQALELAVEGHRVILKADQEYAFQSAKGLNKHIRIEQTNYQISG